MKKVLFAITMLAMVFSVSELRSQDLEEILGQVTDMKSKAVYASDYKFDTYLQLEISDMGDDNIVYDTYLTKDGSSYAVLFTEGGAKSVIVVDTKNSSILMLSDDEGEKTGVAMAVNPKALEEVTAEVKEGDISYADFKTGNTKEILGYKCVEYLIEEDGSTSRLWASEELGKEVEQDMLGNQHIFGGAFIHSTGMNGMVLEYHFTDGSDTRTLKVTRIDLKASYSVNIGDYAVMSMGQ
ncbi:MAG: DUF4412 domain-containing protein [Bacteroidota bacterium]